jgi:hypothetical protein
VTQPGSRPSWRRSGGAGWAVTLGVILVWDATAPETMSEAFRRTLQTRRGRAASVLLWAYLTAHLFEVIPSRADPLGRAQGAWHRHRTIT